MSFHVNWFATNIPKWEKLLKKFKNKPSLSFLEVGCYEGRATLWLMKNILTHPSSKITVIDTFKGSMENVELGHKINTLLNDFKKNLASYLSSDLGKSKVIILKGFSQEIIRTFGSKAKFDFIYIDGSHIAKDVLEDALLCWRLLKKSGVMIFDDYGWRVYKNPLLRPDLAIQAFLGVFEGQYDILDIGYQIAILKKSDNVPISKTITRNSKLKSLFPNRDEIDQLQLINYKLSEDIKKIQSAKAYRIWQAYCSLRKKVKLILK